MSMNTCPRCGDIYDTDHHMHIDTVKGSTFEGEMICTSCWEDIPEEE